MADRIDPKADLRGGKLLLRGRTFWEVGEALFRLCMYFVAISGTKVSPGRVASRDVDGPVLLPADIEGSPVDAVDASY